MKLAGRQQPARRACINARMYGCFCGRECTGFRNLTERHCHQKQPRLCDVPPNRREHSRCRGHTSSSAYCNGSGRVRRPCGRIHTCHPNAAMLRERFPEKKPLSIFLSPMEIDKALPGCYHEFACKSTGQTIGFAHRRRQCQLAAAFVMNKYSTVRKSAQVFYRSIIFNYFDIL